MQLPRDAERIETLRSTLLDRFEFPKDGILNAPELDTASVTAVLLCGPQTLARVLGVNLDLLEQIPGLLKQRADPATADAAGASLSQINQTLGAAVDKLFAGCPPNGIFAPTFPPYDKTGVRMEAAGVLNGALLFEYLKRQETSATPNYYPDAPQLPSAFLDRRLVACGQALADIRTQLDQP